MMSPAGPKTSSLAVLLAITIGAQLALAAAPGSLVVETIQDLDSFESLLTVGSDGNIYGTTKVYALGGGTVFRIDSAGNFSTIHTFSPADGFPSRLALGHDGALYGYVGGGEFLGPYGRFFRISQGAYTDVVALPRPLASELVVGSDGAFYAAQATLFCQQSPCPWSSNAVLRMESNGTYTSLGGALGPYSTAVPTIVGSDGALYGVRDELVIGGIGSMMRWDSAGTATVIHTYAAEEFSGAHSLGSDGLLYWTVEYGGPSGVGRVFRAGNTGQVTHLHDFNGLDGSAPGPFLTAGSGGSMYGTTFTGGSLGAGTVFRIDAAGVFTLLHSFDFPAEGGYPTTALMKARDGLLYGATSGRSVYVVDNAGAVSAYPVIPAILDPSSPFVQGNDCALYGIADTWNAALQQPNTTLYRAFEPSHLCQRIDFAPIPGRRFGGRPFTVNASASSGLPVSLRTKGVCSVRGDQIRLIGIGTCAVTASQKGDSRYGAAPPVTQKFRVSGPRHRHEHRHGRVVLH